MKNLIEQEASELMSSVDLVTIINKVRAEEGNNTEIRHSTFLEKVEKVLDGGEQLLLSTYLDGSNRDSKCYMLPRRECNLMVMSESYKVQAAVYDKMESKHKPLTHLEMVLVQAQKAVEHERAITELQFQQEETACQVKALVNGEDFFTIVGYSNIAKKSVNTQLASDLGRAASKICRSRNIEIGTAPHPIYATCGSYPREVLAEVFDNHFNGGI